MDIEAEPLLGDVVEVEHLGQPEVEGGPARLLVVVAPQLEIQGVLAEPGVLDQ
jgi:hypothetical protein